MRLLESGLPIVSITVMVQKEVALRVCARPGGKDYGVLSVMAQLNAQPVLIETVPASAFVPSPRVDSALLHMPVREAVR
jgi:16S rRNA (adenine1518-N6/adenine1519-N6)-dimethyltransferase